MRWRILFSRGEELRFLSHLELMRLWERAFVRAGVPLAYSQGFSPHPRLAAACPLPVGVTAEGELWDVRLKAHTAPEAFREAIASQLPAGINLEGLWAVDEAAPSLASQVRWLHYRLLGRGDGVEAKVISFLALTALPWEEVGREKQRRYDLRQQVADIKVISSQGGQVVADMKLSLRGRPEQVASALGVEVVAVHRCRLELA